jgi:hypothetical protein
MVLLASEFDKSRFLRAVDLSGEKKFRIKAVTTETVGEEKQRKPVIWFTNDERGLLLNKTNLRTLSGAFGDNMEAWVGKIIVAFPTMTDFRGKMVSALRVRILPPKQPATSPASSAGNGAAVAAPPPKPTPSATAVSTDDLELADEPKKPSADELDDEILF